MWTFTGGCHYPADCNHFMQQCGNCPFLKHPKEKDISRKGWLAKKEIYQQNNNIVFVACSEWMAKMARQSSLLQGAKIIAIPNPINTQILWENVSTPPYLLQMPGIIVPMQRLPL